MGVNCAGVSKQNPSRETRTGLPPVAKTIGLFVSIDEEWSRLRAIQFSTLKRLANVRLVSHLFAASLVVWALHRNIGLEWLAPWVVLVGLANFQQNKHDQMLAGADSANITRRELNAHMLLAAGSGLVWSAPTLVFAFFASPVELAYIWAISAMLILGTVVFYSAAPQGVLAFCAVLGLGSLAGFGLQGQIELALLACVFAAIAITGAIDIGRTFVKARLAESGEAEKDEVVSLLLREFEENEADWLWQIDTTRRIRAVSPRFAYALSQKQEDAEGKPLLELIAGKHWESGKFPPSLHDLAEKLKQKESFSNLIVEVSIRGELRWWELSGTPMRDAKGGFVGFRGVGSDVTSQRESSEKIAYLARFDTLTTLPNRLQLTETLGDALRYAEQWRTKCAFLMIDLDRFKAVNDTLGHLVGDKLLAQVAGRLKALSNDNQLCGRLGGDEFAVVIRDASEPKIVSKVAGEVIEQLSRPYQVDNHTLYVGASVGSAVGPSDGTTVEELMRNADLALYKSKDEGGGTHFVFEPSLHAYAEERRQLELALREALPNEEFVLHYQPVVDANDHRVISFEALVRWNSKEHGFVSPAKFIPLAEDTRLIVPIGKWVLRKACMEARKWPDPVKVNVNVSPEQLLEPDFTNEVVEALAMSGLRPERLEIEVTESIFLRDASVARAALEQVMALGCAVALDDFGTGYSSLGYLRKLRFSTIKVDKTFVQGAAQNNAESLAIVRAVVAMAQSLDMTTTAEGVETAEEAELIRTLGCNKIQGYYFGRPMTADDAMRLFIRSDRRTA